MIDNPTKNINGNSTKLFYRMEVQEKSAVQSFLRFPNDSYVLAYKTTPFGIRINLLSIILSN